MLEQLILIGFGIIVICSFILGAQVFVWVWDLWDKHQEKRKRLKKTYPELCRKSVDDYWKGAA